MSVSKHPKRPKWRRRGPSKVLANMVIDAANAAQSPKRRVLHMPAVQFMLALSVASFGIVTCYGRSPAYSGENVVAGATSGSVFENDLGSVDPLDSIYDHVPLFYDGRRLRSGPAARRKGPRSKSEIERERREKWDRTGREVDEVYAEYAARFRRGPDQLVGVIYSRYSTRFQDSIADQVRTILERALELGIYVPRKHIFFDLAVRGFKKQRDGLSGAEQTLRGKQAKVLLLFSTSRLFRKRYRTLEFVDRIHKGLNVRCIFVKSGVDTDDKARWESILAVQSMIDEFVVTMYAENVRSAHEGLLAKRFAFGTLSYGFMGEAIEGEFTNLGRPRRRIILDSETAAVVLQIFKWYVEDELPLNEIIRRLNGNPEIPLPPRATSGEWSRLAVKGILTNSRYVGLWKYGVTESVYVPDGDYTRQRMRAEPLKEVRFDDLRIISEELWTKAQLRIARQGSNGGRRAKDGDRRSRPRLLNGILVCPVHDDRPLYVSGPYGKQMHCPSCRRLPRDQRPLYSILNRRLAVELLCRTLADLIRLDAGLVEAALAACAREVEQAQRPDPARLTQLRNQVEKFDRAIALTRRTAGDTEEDQAEATAFIKAQQRERAEVTAEVKVLEAALTRQAKMPTAAEAQEMVDEMSAILVRAAESEEEADVARARKIIKLLTGGRIELEQAGECRAKRGWLRGGFRLRLLAVLVERLSGVPATQTDDGIEVTIDFRRPSPMDADALKAWNWKQEARLRGEELPNTEIAKRLGCGRSMVTKLLKHAAAMNGVPYEDGRRCRPKNRAAWKHLDKVAEVGRMVDEGLLLAEIADCLELDRNDVTRAYNLYREQQGLPPLDGRARRKLLDRKNRPPSDDAPS